MHAESGFKWRTRLRVALLMEVVMMSMGSIPEPQSTKSGPTGEQRLRSAKPKFAGKPNAAWFVATKVEQTSREPTDVPGIFVASYRVTLDIKEALPPAAVKQMVVAGQVGQGPEAGALGLQDWLPIKVGAQCVLAFDPRDAETAEHMIYLAGGADAERTWNDCKRFYECYAADGTLDPHRVAAAIAREPMPSATFFRLVFEYDRRLYDSAEVCKSLGAYLSMKQLPPLERRKVVAHYMAKPNAGDADALQAVALGMINLALDLAADRQEASAGVVLQRMLGFFRDADTGRYLIQAPDLADRLETVTRLLASPAVGLDDSSQASLRGWLMRQGSQHEP